MAQTRTSGHLPALDPRILLRDAAAAKRQLSCLRLKGRKHLLNPLEAKASYSFFKKASLSCSNIRRLVLAKFGNLCRPDRSARCKFGCGIPPHQAHILGGCRHHNGLYVSRHDRAVGSIFRFLHKARPDCEIVVHGAHRPKEASPTIPSRIYGSLRPSKLYNIQQCNLQPDIMLIDHSNKSVDILEIGVSHWPHVPKLTISKPSHYNRLRDAILKGRSYSCCLKGLVLGNLGEIPQGAIHALALSAKTSRKDSLKCLQQASRRITADALYLFTASLAD